MVLGPLVDGAHSGVSDICHPDSRIVQRLLPLVRFLEAAGRPRGTLGQKSEKSENSHFENLIFDKIHIFKVSFLTKFTFSKASFLQKITFSKFHF